MFFDALAVLVITFFASIGMVEAAEWLLKNPLRKKIKHKIFVVAKVSSAEEEDIEPALRSVFAETDGLHREVFLDCEGISEEAMRICKRLERRFDCSLFRGEDELVSMFREGLQEKENRLYYIYYIGRRKTRCLIKTKNRNPSR